VRTMIAPLDPEVEAELAGLDGRLENIARRYVRRLVLQPFLGGGVSRGELADVGSRRVYFDVDDRPDDLFGARAACKRRGDESVDEGPRWRIIYWVGEAARSDLRVIVILAVGKGHPTPGWGSAYDLAKRRLRRLIPTERRSS
jgi:hypothetical protein